MLYQILAYMPGKPPQPLGAQALLDYALRRLAGRPHSVAEIREKLAARAADPADVTGVLERLKEYGYINDQRLSEAFAAARLQNEGFGKARVVRDLRKKRVAPAVADRAVSEVYRGADEAALIEAFLKRKYRGKALDAFLAEPKNLASAYRRLRVAGFTSGNAVRVLKRFASDPDALDAIEDSAEDHD